METAGLETRGTSGASHIERTRRTSLTNEQVIEGFEKLLGPKKVLSRLIERTAKAGDASIYRLVPMVVVLPETVDDIVAILDFCRRTQLHLTFRAAGTSLSGQAVTDGVLVEISGGWKGLKIEDGGAVVSVEPGVIASHVNAFLAPYRRKIGPDPASINACMMGGVAANNASGMCCGVEFNTYHTLAGLKVVLPDGFVLDTRNRNAGEQLRTQRPQLWKGLQELRERILSKPEMVETLRRKFSIKNTCGLSMNAFIDFENPVDILSHLLIGSEGTLGFISEVSLNTLPDLPQKATALVYFADIADAGRSIEPLEQAGAAVLEIMDRASMISVAEEMHYPFLLTGEQTSHPTDHVPNLGKSEGDSPIAQTPNYDLESNLKGTYTNERVVVSGNCAALLIEFQEESEEVLGQRLEKAEEILSEFELLAPPEFTRDARVQADYWHMRKGLFPSVGAMREIGTAVIIEDVCVQPKFLAECILDIQGLFVKHAFPDAIIFGHARNGNIHFVISTDFGDAGQVQQYADLMDELTHLVVEKYDGSLKAEHGTGRNIAPFVELEWGQDIYELMWEVKGLLDPNNLLSPGVVLNRDPLAHLKDLKVMPAVSPVVDKCIECGFCEPRCPSRDLTLTPRQRIAVARDIERLLQLGTPEALVDAGILRKDYEYYGNETCATDGMCATACPVKINTGEMIKDLRFADHSKSEKKMASRAVKHFGLAMKGARFGLSALKLGGGPAQAVARIGSAALNKLTGGAVPRFPSNMPFPAPAPRLPVVAGRVKGAVPVVYYPTCLTRSMGKLEGEEVTVGLAEAVVTILEKCGRVVTIPESINQLCCGQPFFSKGFYEAGAEAAGKVVEELYAVSDGGKIAIVCDTSPCSGQFQQGEKYLKGEILKKWKALRVIDFPDYIAGEIIPERSDWPKLKRFAMLHPTCTTMKAGGVPALRKIAQTFAEGAEVPVQAECCGFAGDRGFLFPELTLSATYRESQEVLSRSHAERLPETHPGVRPGGAGDLPISCYSTCRTCEIGMTAGTGQVYSNLVYLVYDALQTEAKE